jgi:two-component system CheB/CheR fusion protein
MVLQKLESIDHYVRYLQESPGELEALFEDMLINVTGFFRDPGLFDVLKNKVFPRIVQGKPVERAIRVWVPGCSTGEEPYSIAIALLEFLAEQEIQSPIQVFATDVSELALEKARAGRFPESIAADVSPERLRRFFAGSEQGYQITKTVRDMCVFAKQNVTKDPPFSQLDLLSCRNLLIYLGPVLQERIIPAFHYALKPTGFLMLGTSETIGGFSDLFSLTERKYKIYTKKPVTPRLPVDLGTVEPAPGPEATEPSGAGRSGVDFQREADRVVLAKYAPPGVVINEAMKILQFRGHTGRYLEPASGEASLNLLKMAREGLLFDLRACVHNAKKAGAAVRKEGLKVRYNGNRLKVNLEVIPLGPSEAEDFHFLVLFDEVSASPAEMKPPTTKRKPKPGQASAAEGELDRLRAELAGIEETLQATIEEHESSNEELCAANEEIQSSNEELQSTNEELETAKEELQSTNEELTTLNEELENSNIELNQAINDLNNLLTCVNIPILILGSDLRIRSFTPLAEKVLKLIPADVGRPIGQLKLGVQVEDLEGQIVEVIETLNMKEEEVQADDGRWYSLRIRPYRTIDDKIDGAVAALIDVTDQKRAQEREREGEEIARILAQSVVETNTAFYDAFGFAPQRTEGQLLYDLGNRQWDISALRKLLEEIIPQNAHFDGFRVEYDFPDIGHKVMLLNARRIDQPGGRPQLILIAIEEIEDGQDTGR